ncbi:hypothetical protein P43SY_000314 [Pythium insidiosum]|uniref:Protein kinase domain-containing protein n=1 Tax=Pythium insidiosum TaxID=114742 RepID=A0AAD5LAZ5_PYTIN|nr:hypothetical protein P43SY_000314 [Pythium insidiosum]
MVPPIPGVEQAMATQGRDLPWFMVASGFIAVSILLSEIVLLCMRWGGVKKPPSRKLRSCSSRYVPPTDTYFSTLPGVSLWDEKLLINRYIPSNQVEDVRVLGGGAFGVVYLVRIRSRQLAAAKRLSASRRYDDVSQKLLIDEIKLQAELQHPNIVALIGVSWTTRADLQAIFEYMRDGDLRTFLETTRGSERESHLPVAPSDLPVTPASWSRQKLQLALDVAYALAYLHSQRPTGLIHRDLKSGNILLCDEATCHTSGGRLPHSEQSPRQPRLRAKLGDFGVSRLMSTSHSMTTGVGTSRWLAPEVILGGGVYNAACDVYSFGVVLTELDTHCVPFSDVRGHDGTMLPDIVVLQRVAHERLQPSLSPLCPEPIAALARQCMAHEAAERPSASAICNALRDLLHEEAKM